MIASAAIDVDVVIVGAGFCGLSLSFLLKERGLRSVLLERADRIGGKARTLVREGNVLELGTCYLARDYHEVAALAARFDLSTTALGSVSSHPDSPLTAFYNRTALGYLRDAVGLMATLRRYSTRRRVALARFASRVEAEYDALGQPITDWLARHRCLRLVPIFNGLLDIYGYGPVSAMPALYALRWMTPALIMTAFLKGSRQIDLGFGELSRRLADHADVRLSTVVTGSSETATAVGAC